MGFADERELTVLLIVFSVFVMTVLSQNIGVIYFGMAISYLVFIGLPGFKKIELSRNYKATNILIGAFLLVAAFTAIAAIALGTTENVIKAVTFFASSFLVNFTINEPIIKTFVFGIMIPVIETLFFFGVIFPFALKKSQARESLNDMQTWLAIILVAGIATSFHFLVRLLNDQALITDLLFFGISGAIVVYQKEMSGATAGHIGFNTFSILKILGVLK